MYINQNIHDIHISHIQQFFPEKKQKDLNPNHYSSLAFTLGLYTFLSATFFTFSETSCLFSMLIMCHYPVIGSASDWLKQISHTAWPIRSTTDQGRLVMHHQYGISALASQTSFHRESSDDVAKCWLFSQANSKAIPEVSLLNKFIQAFFVLKLLCPNFKTESNSRFFFHNWS